MTYVYIKDTTNFTTNPNDNTKTKANDVKKTSEYKVILPQTGENESLSSIYRSLGLFLTIGTPIMILFKRNRRY